MQRFGCLGNVLPSIEVGPQRRERLSCLMLRQLQNGLQYLIDHRPNAIDLGPSNQCPTEAQSIELLDLDGANATTTDVMNLAFGVDPA